MSKKKVEGTLLIAGLILIAMYFVLKLIFDFFNFIGSVVSDNINIINILLASGITIFISYLVYSELFFRSSRFNKIKQSISKHTKNCNELNHYIEQLKEFYLNIESYNYGTAEISDKSLYNFQRKEWSKVIKNNQIYYCSATVCINANNQPIKYLCKYFGIQNNEDSLSTFEKVLNDFTSVEQGKDLIKRERESILDSVSQSIPFLIQVFSNKKLVRKLGFETVDISDSYIPTFTFQYISAGGNSSSKSDIKLDIENLNNLISYLNDSINWSKSIAGQRALMTSQLREEIKKRDNYKCCLCSLSTKEEPNLLLEIDHKIPLSKGGMTTYNNLQTLCWRCNRSKGAKI